MNNADRRVNMHYQAMLCGNFLKAAEFGTGTIPAQPTYTIANVVLEKLESVAMNDTDGASSKIKTKGVIYFKEVERGWVLNRTNAECLAALFGKETNEWLGKRVTLFAADVRVGPKMDIGIRIKGSPDIAAEVTVMVKLPRRKPIPMRLVPTGGAAVGGPASGAASGTAPPTFSDCTTVESLKAAWSALTPDAQATPGAKAAYKSRLEAIRAPARPTVAVPPPDEEERA